MLPEIKIHFSSDIRRRTGPRAGGRLWFQFVRIPRSAMRGLSRRVGAFWFVLPFVFVAVLPRG